MSTNFYYFNKFLYKNYKITVSEGYLLNILVNTKNGIEKAHFLNYKMRKIAIDTITEILEKLLTNEKIEINKICAKTTIDVLKEILKINIKNET